MDNRVEVTVLVRATWTPDLKEDIEYPAIEDYAIRVQEQFKADPLEALRKLPNPEVVETSVVVQRPQEIGKHRINVYLDEESHPYDAYWAECSCGNWRTQPAFSDPTYARAASKAHLQEVGT